MLTFNFFIWLWVIGWDSNFLHPKLWVILSALISWDLSWNTKVEHPVDNEQFSNFISVGIAQWYFFRSLDGSVNHCEYFEKMEEELLSLDEELWVSLSALVSWDLIWNTKVEYPVDVRFVQALAANAKKKNSRCIFHAYLNTKYTMERKIVNMQKHSSKVLARTPFLQIDLKFRSGKMDLGGKESWWYQILSPRFNSKLMK